MTYTCTVCPLSCTVEVTPDGDGFKATGNTCPRGAKFAINEHTVPKRMITTTVRVENGLLNRIPVVSTDEVPKSQLRQCLNAIYQIKVAAPIQDGQILIENICGTGVDIIASRAMKEG